MDEAAAVVLEAESSELSIFSVGGFGTLRRSVSDLDMGTSSLHEGGNGVLGSGLACVVSAGMLCLCWLY